LPTLSALFHIWYNIVMEEVWKPVYGYSGRYQISSFGRLKGPRGITCGAVGSRGYLQACLRKPKEKYGKSVNMHVLVAKAFLGKRPHKSHVCHKDGNKLNNRLDNLRYDTPKGNWNDFRENPGSTSHSIGKTHCPAGHLLQEPNLMGSQLARGWRSCLSCSRAAAYVRNGKYGANKDKLALANEYYKEVMENAS
jgi:hypothetical protein